MPPGTGTGAAVPFVHGWKVDDLLFIGGQRSLDTTGKVLGRRRHRDADRAAFRNLDTMLRAAAATATT